MLGDPRTYRNIVTNDSLQHFTIGEVGRIQDLVGNYMVFQDLQISDNYSHPPQAESELVK